MLNTIFDPAQTERLYHDLRRANSEAAKKERFLTYVTRVFQNDDKVQDFIRDMALGAETSIANITRKGRMARGRADSQTDTVIIEWERDLSRTGDHAKDQLREYLEGNWRSGQEYKFTLLSTDGVRWRRYAPDWSKLAVDDLMGQNFELREVQAFDLAPSNFGEFPFFLDEVFFANEPKVATLENIRADFGDTSRAFINSINALTRCLPALERQSELKVAFEQWNRFLSIAYGQFDNSPKLFLVHTYLSVFAKFIAYSVLAREPAADDETIRDILSGRIFDRLNVERFVEDDFFHWVWGDEFLPVLRPMFREISRQIDAYEFSEVREDILKGVYQELIDLETRHALGEYYTPDWLCERILEELPLEKASSILDPACGSGSFLRAAIARMRREFPDVGAERLAEQVVGIDIHPLSVLIAKTTVLLSLGGGRSDRPGVLSPYTSTSPTACSCLAGPPTCSNRVSKSLSTMPHTRLTLGGVCREPALAYLRGCVERRLSEPPPNAFRPLQGNPREPGKLPSSRDRGHLPRSCGQLLYEAERDARLRTSAQLMSADQHDPSRAGNVLGLRLTAVWDLDRVAPLFRVPCCVMFAQYGSDEPGENALPQLGIPGYAVSGRLSKAQVHLSETTGRLTWNKTRWYFSRLQSTRRRTKSALTATASDALSGTNAYSSKFTQGATVVPRNFFFVDVAQDVDRADLRDRVLALESAAAADREAKKPWKGLRIHERAEGSLLYRTAISRNVVPFSLVEPPLVLLPVVEEEGKFKVLDADALTAKGFRFASMWFAQAEELWESHRTERNAENTLGSYLDWQSKLTGQNPRARHLVLYTSSATDASAVVIDRESFDHPFIVDHKTYWCEVRSEQEAHYLSSFINSGYANAVIKDFQSRGLFGPRDIHKTIVKVPFPRFKASEPEHEQLSELGRRCAAAALRAVSEEEDLDLTPRILGRVRSRIRQVIYEDMKVIDEIVERLSRGQDKAKTSDQPRRQSRRRKVSRGLFD